MPRRRLLEADRPERVGRRCAVAILVAFDRPRDALVIVSGVRERGAKRGGVGVRAGCHERAHADLDRVVRRQPERIDGGLGSTGDLLQQRVVTVLGALRKRDQRAREAAGFLGERDGLGVVDELLRLRRAVTAVPRGLVEALHRSGGGQDVGDLLEAGQVHRSVAAGLRHLLRDRLERGAEVGGVRRVAEPVGDRDALGGCRRAHGVGQALVAPIVAPERYDRLLACVLDESDDPAPVIDSNAPTRTSVLLDCAGADSVPSANTDASATTAPSAKGRRRTRRMRLSTPPRRCAIPWSLPGVAQAALDEAYALRPEHPVLRVWKARFDAQTVVVTPAETPAPRGSPTDVVLVVFSLIAFGFAKLPWLVAGIDASAYLGRNGGFLATIPLAPWVVNARADSARASTLVVVLFAGLLLHANLALDRPGDANVLAFIHLPILQWTLVALAFHRGWGWWGGAGLLASTRGKYPLIKRRRDITSLSDVHSHVI